MSQTVPTRTRRVLLVNTNRYDQPYPVYPLSVAYLQASLRAAGHECRIWDALSAKATLEEMIADFSPDHVGISVRNVDNVQAHNPRSFIHDLLDYCRRVRAATTATLVLGGSGFSVFPRELLALTQADFGIAGEGERALVELVDALRDSTEYRGIAGLVWREADGRVALCPRNPKGEIFSVDPEHDQELIRFYVERGSIPGVQTQRGCPLRCCYCTYPLIEGKKSRFRTGAEIVEEMRRLLALGVKYTFIVDSVFNTSREHIVSVCEALAAAKLDMEWGCFLRPRNATRELLELMKRAGARHIEFGSDSFSDSVLKAYAKSFTWEEIQRASLDCHELGLHYSHFLIFGGPGETAETIDETLARAATLPESFFFGTVGMRIYPDTPLWRELGCDARGELPGEYLVEPRFHIQPPLTVDSIMARLSSVQVNSARWMIGDPPQQFRETIDMLRRRGVRGPIWEYVELLQRFTKPAVVA